MALGPPAWIGTKLAKVNGRNGFVYLLPIIRGSRRLILEFSYLFIV
jgi:hypothetical protein